ncbi:MAG: monovalent cation/H(+) antiporter subunit G [Pseudomonadota bacterium]
MDIVASILGGLCLLAGSVFTVIGGLGIVRMPDLFTRLHAAGVIDTLGAALILLGLVFFAGFSLVSVKLILVLAFLLITAPVASHALAKAGLHGGRRPMVAESIELGRERD